MRPESDASNPEMARPCDVSIAVVQWQDQFLIGARSLQQPLGGYHEFPGGKVEPGERPAHAAVRECREETDIAIEVVRLLHDLPCHYAHGLLHLFFFLAQPIKSPPAPRPPFVWTPRQALAECRFPEANRQVVAMLQDGEFRV